MNIVITGAGGFVGRQLALALMAANQHSLTLVDQAFPHGFAEGDARVRKLAGPLQDADIQQQAFQQGVDVLFHLAAVPGGAAEANPELSRAVNLDGTLDLVERAANAGACPRVVFSSSIAVFGASLPETVDDHTAIAPAMVYGAHKAMTELALANMSQRGLIDSVGVRLPGILARPKAPSGLKSAFMSDVFHALKAGEPFVSPVSAEATFWLMSVNRCVENLLHAATLDTSLMPESRVVTLPALRCTMADLVTEVARQQAFSQSLVSYQPDAQLEKLFGTQPKLQTPAADKAGFAHDGCVEALVAQAFKTLA